MREGAQLSKIADSFSTEYYAWEIAGAPGRVNLRLDVVSDIARHFQKLLSSHPDHRWFGLLLGHVARTRAITIDGFEAIDTSREEGFEPALIRWARNADPELSVVGYCRGGSGEGFSLSGDDLALLQAHFTRPLSVVMLVKPSLAGTTAATAGYFFAEFGEARSRFCLSRFPLERSMLAEEASNRKPVEREVAPRLTTVPPQPSLVSQTTAAAQPPVVAPPAAVAQHTVIAKPVLAAPPPVVSKPVVPAPPSVVTKPAAPAPPPVTAKPVTPAQSTVLAKPAAPSQSPVAAQSTPHIVRVASSATTVVAPTSPPKEQTQPESVAATEEAQPESLLQKVMDSQRILWMSGICAVALLLGYLVFSRTASHPPNVSLSLSAKRTAEGLEIRWDRNAPLATAQGALLSIREGEFQKDLYLDLAQLRTGHVVYYPQSNGDVQLRMDLFAATAKTSGQSMVIVGRGEPSGAAEPQPAIEPANTLPATAQAPKPSPLSPVLASAATTVSQSVPTASAAPVDAVQVPGAPAKPESARPFQPPPARIATDSAVVVAGPPEIEGSVASETSVLISSSPAALPTALPGAPPSPSAAPTAAAPAETKTAGPGPKYLNLGSGGIIVEARPISRVMPSIPPDARTWKRNGVEVSVRVKIDADGKVASAEVQNGNSQTDHLLGRLAVDAARQWRFEPARSLDRRIPSEMVLRFRF